MKLLLVRTMLVLYVATMATTVRADDIIVDRYQELTGEIDGNIIVVEGGYCIVQDATIHGLLRSRTPEMGRE